MALLGPGRRVATSRRREAVLIRDTRRDGPPAGTPSPSVNENTVHIENSVRNDSCP